MSSVWSTKASTNNQLAAAAATATAAAAVDGRSPTGTPLMQRPGQQRSGSSAEPSPLLRRASTSAPGTPLGVRRTSGPMPGHVAAAAAEACASARRRASESDVHALGLDERQRLSCEALLRNTSSSHAAAPSLTVTPAGLAGLESYSADRAGSSQEGASAPEDETFLDKVGSWFGQSFKGPEAPSTPPRPPETSRPKPIIIDCQELGGASRNVSWEMAPDALVSDVCEGAAQRLGVRADECSMLHEGRELTASDFSLSQRIDHLVDPGQRLKLQVAGGLS